ncbi:hypothetical protein MRI28_10335 [Nocardiopsis dassonvillei]|uniref:hypothetical protein n=1 Tax=Nocardiopsis dassonvillei TaxID=2014 RepID=UPI00200E2D3B|nr:hypothetical protein [Nocardiopsis dassonvillei]MCK9870038.1 hypothetical protein [Nocardiopsis dassonvillei]
MFRRWLPLLLVVCVSSACADDGTEGADGRGEPSASPSDAGPDAELVAWVDEFCAVPEVMPDLLSYSFAAMARSNPTVEEDRQPLLDALAEADQALADLDEAAAELLPAPVPAGDEAVERYRTDMEERRTELAEYAENAPTYAAEDLGGLYVLGGLTVTELPISSDMPSYFAEDDAELVAASESATNCGGAAEDGE